jgi:hypothetical protein
VIHTELQGQIPTIRLYSQDAAIAHLTAAGFTGIEAVGDDFEPVGSDANYFKLVGLRP